MTTTTSYVVTVAESDRGNYHIASDETLSPFCGTKPQQKITHITVDNFDHWKSWFCNRCYYLHLTDGKWDGR